MERAKVIADWVMMQPTSEFSRKMQSEKSLSLDEEDETARILDDRTAVLSDGCRLRLTPKGQKTVDQLVFVGDEIKASYDGASRVVGIHRHETFGLSNYTLVIVDLETMPSSEGFYRESDLGWINECVAQDGEVRMLFEANEDTVQIVKECKEARQQTLDGAYSQKPYLKIPDGTRHATIRVTIEMEKSTFCIFDPPYYCIDFRCNGCDQGCGGGHCCQNPKDIDRDLERYKQRLLQCRDPHRGDRHIIVDVKDDRARKKRQAKLGKKKLLE